jgi:two-component system, sensor histidine kinase and response regulator
LHILLAEDNAVNQRLLFLLLRKHGHTVVVVNNGQEALEALTEQQFDLVLMDIQMPVMGGLEATAHIRKQERLADRRTPIVAVTANTAMGAREQYLAAGLDGYVPKPVQTAELLKVMAEVMSEAEPEAALATMLPVS